MNQKVLPTPGWLCTPHSPPISAVSCLLQRRDGRGFVVTLYTEEGNVELVGNNVPVFLNQDAIKFLCGSMQWTWRPTAGARMLRLATSGA